MSFVLLIVGAFLYFAGRIEMGTLRAEGRHVKAAGVILALPAIIVILMNFLFIPLAFGSNEGAAQSAIDFVGLLEIVGMLVAAGIAYILIADPPNAPRLPGLLGEIQTEARGSTVKTPRPQAPKQGKIINIPTASTPLRPKISLNRDNFPSIMNLKEAARYLQTTEEDILQMIDEGKLTAARDNYNYKIAKSQLDELL